MEVKATVDEVKNQVTKQQTFCQQTQVNNEHRFTVIESGLDIIKLNKIANNLSEIVNCEGC